MSTNSRIRKVREIKGLSQSEMASYLDIPLRTYQRLEQEDRDLKGSVLLKFARIGVNPLWLLTGEGPIFKEVDQTIKAASRGLDPQVVKDVIETLEELLEREKVHLPPSKKAELVVLLAEEVQEEEQELSPGRILRLIKLAS